MKYVIKMKQSKINSDFFYKVCTYELFELSYSPFKKTILKKGFCLFHKFDVFYDFLINK